MASGQTLTPQADRSATARWYLGFDCATKTFAFSLSCVDLGAFRAERALLLRRARAAQEVLRRAKARIAEARAAFASGGAGASAAQAALAEAAAMVGAVSPSVEADLATSATFIRLIDGEVADLVPGQPDDDIPTVARVRAVVQYVETRVRPAVARALPPGARLRVAVEFQMGPNAPARTVAAALVTLFAADEVFLVGPTLKNRIHTREEGRYCYFAERYASAYAANKAHAKSNFAHVEAVFGSQIPATRPPALRGHIADSFMQVLGHEICGPGDEKAASSF